MSISRRPSEGWGPSGARASAPFTPWDPSLRWDDGVLQ